MKQNQIESAIKNALDSRAKARMRRWMAVWRLPAILIVGLFVAMILFAKLDHAYPNFVYLFR